MEKTLHRHTFLVAGVLLFAVFFVRFASADGRVLVIGIDGAGGSFLRDANTPNIDAIMADGAARYDFLNEGALVNAPPEGYGASGVNWSTITTGASAAHHGVADNSFTGNRYDQYPHFFKYIEQQRPELFTASIVNWSPINDFILANVAADLELGGVSDVAVKDATVNLLQTGDPHAVFLHFDQVDAAGHSSGWGTSPFYVAIQNVDALIGNVMTALHARPGVISGAESWLVMVTADHGGQGTSHFASQGPINWEVPLVIGGPTVADGVALKQGTLRDVAPTALWHLGIDPFGTAVNGSVVGIPFGVPNGIAGDVNQDDMLSGNGKGPVSSDDVSAFIQGWMTRDHTSVLAAYGHGDLNLDRVTDIRDWIILNRLDPAMGQAVLRGLAVPEPASGILALVVGTTIFSRSRRLKLKAAEQSSRRATNAAPASGRGSPATGTKSVLMESDPRSEAGAARGALVVVLAIVGLCLSLSSSSSAAIMDELIGFYSFENDFLDTSGSPIASHGTPVNAPQFAAGKIGQAMSLPGIRDYMSLPRSSELNFGATTDFSMSMWIRQDDFLSDPAVLSNKNWNTGDNTGINWAVKGNGIFDLNTKAAGGQRRDLDTAANSAPLGVGVWSLVVMTVDRDGATKLYINGVNTGTIPVTSQGSFNGSLPWNVGQDGTGAYGIEFTGAVDELAIWRRSITADEANQVWNGGAGIDLGNLLLETRLKLVIDRDSGAISLENNTGAPREIIAYQITSAAGAFNRQAWQPIAGRLDDAGSGVVDPDDDWLVLSAPTSKSDLSEASLGSATLASGARIDLGAGVWGKYYEDFADIEFLYADGVGDEPLTGLIEFRGNGGASFPRGDVNFDGDLDSEDWTLMSTLFGGNLATLTQAEGYRRGDLNHDGLHSLEDLDLFRQEYDAAHGAGAFAAMLQGVPEPGSGLVAIMATGVMVVWVRRARPSRCGVIAISMVAMVLCSPRPLEATVLFSQNFDGIPLGPSVNETPAGANVWSNTPPAAWSIDNAGVPAGGMPEWRGWAFAQPTWWATVAQDQGRSQFTKGSGVIAVADPDEWDDAARSPGTYNSFLRTPSISLAGVAPGTAQLRFDSSWLPEDTQTASVAVSYNGVAEVEVLCWTSLTGDQNFKAGNTNETVVVPLNNPGGATTMSLSFGMTEAENDWWWAIDNVLVSTPLTLEVDVNTGQMKLRSDSSIAITGYEIVSAAGSLNPIAWRAGNLDAQNLGAPVPAAADFNQVGGVNQADLALWRSAFDFSANADADDDGDSDGADFLRWQRQVGQPSDSGSTWLTFLGTEERLIESYLFGASTFASDIALGAGYDAVQDARDLIFRYTTAAGEVVTGAVIYAPALQVTPEPAATCLLPMLAIAALAHRRPV